MWYLLTDKYLYASLSSRCPFTNSRSWNDKKQLSGNTLYNGKGNVFGVLQNLTSISCGILNIYLSASLSSSMTCE